MPLHDDNISEPHDVKETPEDKIPDKLNDTELRSLVRTYLTPPALGKHRNKPYYRHVYGLQFREIYDEFMQSKEKKIWRFNKFPQYSSNTLYLKITQAKEYFLAHLDPDGRYKDFDQCVHTHVVKGVGVQMEVRFDILQERVSFNTNPFAPDTVNENTIEWKDRLDKYLETGPHYDKEFREDKLALDEEQQSQLRVELCQLKNIAYNVTSSTIKVVFMKEETTGI